MCKVVLVSVPYKQLDKKYCKDKLINVDDCSNVTVKGEAFLCIQPESSALGCMFNLKWWVKDHLPSVQNHHLEAFLSFYSSLLTPAKAQGSRKDLIFIYFRFWSAICSQWVLKCITAKFFTSFWTIFIGQSCTQADWKADLCRWDVLLSLILFCWTLIGSCIPTSI